MLHLRSWGLLPLAGIEAGVRWAHPRAALGKRPDLPAGFVWLHAASVGEVAALQAVVHALDAAVLLTSDTQEGVERARKMQRARLWCAARPLEHPFSIAPWLAMRPSLLAFSEGTYWPMLARSARSAGVPVLRIAASVSRTGTTRMAQRWLRPDLVVPRTEADANTFRSLGWKVTEPCGDPKLDAPVRSNPLSFAGPFVVVGCGRGEELDVVRATPSTHQIVLAPRRLERIASLKASFPGAQLRSECTAITARVVLWDTMGDLASAYQGADLAVIGGGFAPSGAHSPAEARAAGVPVMVGPNLGKNAHLFAPHEVVETVERLPEHLGQIARPVEQGASARICDAIEGARTLGREVPPRPQLAPLAAAYRAVAGARNTLYDTGVLTTDVGIPVISVGSIDARSPGRSAVVRWLVAELAALNPGVATRGVGRRSRGLALSWLEQDVGDESSLLACPVAACADRTRAALALKHHGCGVVVLDDGLQHRRLARTIDLVILDARTPNARGMLPMGEKREPLPARRTEIWSAHGELVHASRRIHEHTAPPTAPVAAFCALGRPEDFFANLPAGSRHRSFPNHHRYTPRDLQELRSWAGDLPLATTAKDHIKLPPVFAEGVICCPLEVTIDPPPNVEEWLNG